MKLIEGSRHLSERGQALVIGLLVMMVLFVIGAIIVDLGLWLSERRGAQADADFASLAGAWELLAPSAGSGAAVSAADSSRVANDEQGNSVFANVTVDSSCFNRGRLDSVMVNLNHRTKSLFASIFTNVVPNVGAHAKACAGGTNAPRNLVPFEVDNENPACFNGNDTPRFDRLCPIDFGESNLPLIDLDRTGDNCSDASSRENIRRLIEGGGRGICHINSGGSCSGAGNRTHCVQFHRNANLQAVMDGTRARINASAPCDAMPGANGNGIDELRESTELVFDTGSALTSIYHARDCNPGTPGVQISPRLTSVVVLEQAPGNPGSGRFPIAAFVGFFITGCTNEIESNAQIGNVDLDCDYKRGDPGGGDDDGGDDDDDDDDDDDEERHEVVYGQLVNLIVEGSGVGPPSPSTTLFSIALTE
jgi:hypothetical protein